MTDSARLPHGLEPTLEIVLSVGRRPDSPWAVCTLGLFVSEALREPAGRWPDGSLAEVRVKLSPAEADAILAELVSARFFDDAVRTHTARAETSDAAPPAGSTAGAPPDPPVGGARLTVRAHDEHWHYAWSSSRERSQLAALREHLPARADGALDHILYQLPLAQRDPDLELVQAVVLQRAEQVSALLDDGASPDARDHGDTCVLWHAVATDNVAIARLLLDRGADVTEVRLHEVHGDAMAGLLLSRGAQWDVEGGSALYGMGTAVMMRSLLRRGADPNVATDNHETPLTFHADWGNRDAVEELLQAGANPNYVDAEAKVSVLGYAAAAGNWSIVDALLRAGADPQDPEASPPAAARALSAGALVPLRMLLEAGAVISEADWVARRRELEAWLDALEATLRERWASSNPGST